MSILELDEAQDIIDELREEIAALRAELTAEKAAHEATKNDRMAQVVLAAGFEELARIREQERDALKTHAEALAKALKDIQGRGLEAEKRERNMPDGLGQYGVIADVAFDALSSYRQDYPEKP